MPDAFAADPIVAAVQRKMTERSRKGVAEYGADMTRTDVALPQWLEHAQDELLDAAIYLERIKRDVRGAILLLNTAGRCAEDPRAYSYMRAALEVLDWPPAGDAGGEA